MNSPAMTVFKKEIKDALRSRVTVILIIGLSAIVLLSLVVASFEFRAKVIDYQQYLQSLKQSGGSVTDLPPQFFPLQLIRSAVEYLEIIGAIIAIVMGYGLVAKEKNRGTLRLLFSRPIKSADVSVGKLMALACIWLIILVLLSGVMIGSLMIIGGVSLSGTEVVKLFIFAGLAWLYLFMWSVLAMALAGYSKRLSTALVICLVLWLSIVLIIPQIGDTMDPDNQVPGGLFKSLQVDKLHEKAVLAHFTGYETARNLLEETSLSKRFERVSFAYLGIKDEFNQKPLGFIWKTKWPDIATLVGATGLSIVLAIIFSKKQKLLRKEYS